MDIKNTNANTTSTDVDDTLSKLERLAQLKEKGVLTEQEFHEQKKMLLAYPRPVTPVDEIEVGDRKQIEKISNGKTSLASANIIVVVALFVVPLLVVAYLTSVKTNTFVTTPEKKTEIKPITSSPVEPATPTNKVGAKEAVIGTLADTVLEMRGKTLATKQVGHDDQGLLVEWHYPDAIYLMARRLQGGIEAYRVIKITGSNAQMAKAPVAATTESSPTPIPPASLRSGVVSPVDCYDLSRYAEAKGHNFIERAAIVSDAERKGNCKKFTP